MHEGASDSDRAHKQQRESECGLYLIVISSRRGHAGLIKRGMSGDVSEMLI